MSENQILSVPSEIGFLAELSPKDKTKLEKFIEDGMPGLASVDNVKIHTMFEMYLSGNTFSQIARHMHLKKELVLFLGQKLNWFNQKIEQLEDIQESILHRITEDKIRSQDFTLFVAQNWRRVVGGRMGEYLRTGQEELLKGIDLKEMEKYLKIMETLYTESKQVLPKPSPVGLNIGAGVTITKKDDKTVEVTPNEISEKQAAKAVIEAYGKLRRLEEEKNEKKK